MNSLNAMRMPCRLFSSERCAPNSGRAFFITDFAVPPPSSHGGYPERRAPGLSRLAKAGRVFYSESPAYRQGTYRGGPQSQRSESAGTVLVLKRVSQALQLALFHRMSHPGVANGQPQIAYDRGGQGHGRACRESAITPALISRLVMHYRIPDRLSEIHRKLVILANGDANAVHEAIKHNKTLSGVVSALLRHRAFETTQRSAQRSHPELIAG